jgi:DNA-directed RNA polymerase beta subunit
MGVICPIESPDNKDIGLTKHFAVLARVTERGVVQDDVRKCLVDLGMVVSRRRGHPFGSTVHHKVSSPTLRCSVHVSGISACRTSPPRRFHRMASWSVSIEIALRVVFRPYSVVQGWQDPVR